MVTPRVPENRMVVQCRVSVWNRILRHFDALAEDGEHHHCRTYGGCWDDCPACAARKLAKVMRRENL